MTDEQNNDELRFRYLMKSSIDESVKENILVIAQEIARETAKQTVQELSENYIPKDEYYELRNKWIDAQMKREEELKKNWKDAKWKTITGVSTGIIVLLFTNFGSNIISIAKKFFGGD